MDNQLLLLAARGVKKAYKNNVAIGSTNFRVDSVTYQGREWQRLSIAGTNDALDWFWNLFPWTKRGVKAGNALSVGRILKAANLNYGKPVMACGHSKSGATALKLAHLGYVDKCVAFNPAPAFSKSVEIPNAAMVVSQDDFVPKLGRLLFKHPKCEVIKIPKTRRWWQVWGRVKSHFIDSVIAWLEGRSEF